MRWIYLWIFTKFRWTSGSVSPRFRNNKICKKKLKIEKHELCVIKIEWYRKHQPSAKQTRKQLRYETIESQIMRNAKTCLVSLCLHSPKHFINAVSNAQSKFNTRMRETFRARDFNRFFVGRWCWSLHLKWVTQSSSLFIDVEQSRKIHNNNTVPWVSLVSGCERERARDPSHRWN